MKRGEILVQIKKALERGEELSNEQVIELAKLRRETNAGRRFVNVRKLDLRDGEELHDFSWSMFEAVQRDRVILAGGSLDAWLQGIYDDYVIVQDAGTGRLFRAAYARTPEGDFTFEEPTEVRVQYVPVGEEQAQKSVPERIVELTTAQRKWSFLPSTLSDKR